MRELKKEMENICWQKENKTKNDQLVTGEFKQYKTIILRPYIMLPACELIKQMFHGLFKRQTFVLYIVNCDEKYTCTQRSKNNEFIYFSNEFTSIYENFLIKS